VSISNEVAFVTFANTTWSGSFTARGALIYKNGGGAICVLDFRFGQNLNHNFSGAVSRRNEQFGNYSTFIGV
jgi:hypothetical protein